jgi:NTP pyrophosphatase (non-canonical NTP hydrolase)
MITHPELVERLAKPGGDILAALTPADCHLLHMGVGVCGEAGELMDAIKKQTIYRKELDRANVIEELGDLEFYMQGIRAALDITREETLQANIVKLSKRYQEIKYSDKKAAERADKASPQADGKHFANDNPSKDSKSSKLSKPSSASSEIR